MLGLVYGADYRDQDAEGSVRLHCELGRWQVAVPGPRVENSSSYFTHQQQFEIHGRTPRGERRGHEGISTDVAHRSKQNVDHEQAQPAT